MLAEPRVCAWRMMPYILTNYIIYISREIFTDVDSGLFVSLYTYIYMYIYIYIHAQCNTYHITYSLYIYNMCVCTIYYSIMYSKALTALSRVWGLSKV